MHALTFLLIAQNAVAPAAGVPAIDFDLRKAPAPRACAAGGNDIVVCAQDRRPVETLPDIALPAPPKAEITLFGDVKAAAELERAGVGGFVSNRAMVRVKVPF